MSDKDWFGLDDDELDRLEDNTERARIEGNRMYGNGGGNEGNSNSKGKNKRKRT